jgi:hypothetical protein
MRSNQPSRKVPAVSGAAAKLATAIQLCREAAASGAIDPSDRADLERIIRGASGHRAKALQLRAWIDRVLRISEARAIALGDFRIRVVLQRY